MTLPAANSLALEMLGWRSFQDLALTLCEELFAAPVQQFSPIRDLGQDGLIELPYWNTAGPHRSVIQAKHTSRPNASLTAQTMAPEVVKMASLGVSSKIDRYILVTNAKVSAQSRKQIITAFKKVGISEVVVLEKSGIERQIRENPKLRAKVPRLYGIGDLSTILDERRIEQSKAILENIAADLITFVPTETYRRAVDLLNKQKMVVLLGDPASGKTTIANCLIIGSIDQTAADPVIIKSFSEIRKFWNIHSDPRVFYFDDFIGWASLTWPRVHEFNENMDYINAAMRGGCRFIFTSRNYIWQEAQNNIKFSTISSLRGSQVTINLHELSDLEKAQILFNHLRNGNQTVKWKRQFASFYGTVVVDENFTPECARRLSRSEYTDNLRPTAGSVRYFVRQQGECLVESIRGLSKTHRGALAAVYMGGSALSGARKEDPSVQAAMDLYGMNIDEVRTSISSLNDVFVKQGTTREERGWVFKHPTIREAMGVIIQKEPDLVEVAIRGNPMFGLLSESVCEGVVLRGAKFTIPEGLFGLFIARIVEENPSQYFLIEFLSHRASRGFRKQFFGGRASLAMPIIAANVRPSDWTCGFFGVLRSDDLLEDDAVQAMTRALFDQARSYGCVDLPLMARDLLEPAEFALLVQRALETIVENRSSIVENHAECWGREVDPESYFESFAGNLERLATTIDLEFDETWSMELREEIDEQLQYMRENYVVPDDEEDERTIAGPAQHANAQTVSMAEIEAIFADVAG